MKTCEDCGERVYSLGCTNCNEAAYIEEQRQLNALYGYDDVETNCRACFGPCGRCHELATSADAVDPHVADSGKLSTRGDV